MSDLEAGTATEQPADDIRSLLSGAFDEAESASNTQVTETATEPAAGDTETGSSRARDASGKFVKKDEATEKTAKVEKTDPVESKPATEKTAATTDDAAKTATATSSTEAPAHWSDADKAMFKAQSPEAQKFLLERVKATDADYTRKTQAVAHLQKEYGPVDELFAPHKDAMRQKGFTPRSLIEAWANVEQKLAAGPDSAIEVIKGLVGGYNLPREKIAQALGLTAQAAQQTQQNNQQQATAVENGQQVALPPEVQAELKALREQVGQFGQKFQTIEQREHAARQVQQQAEEAAVDKTITDFKSAVDDKGQLLHPHFDEVRPTMDTLAQAALASKQFPMPTIKELYETAVWANPSTRDKVLTARAQQEEAKRVEEARAKAASARRAGSSVTGAPGTGQAPSGRQGSELSLREQLEAAAEDAA